MDSSQPVTLGTTAGTPSDKLFASNNNNTANELGAVLTASLAHRARYFPSVDAFISAMHSSPPALAPPAAPLPLRPRPPAEPAAPQPRGPLLPQGRLWAGEAPLHPALASELLQPVPASGPCPAWALSQFEAPTRAPRSAARVRALKRAAQQRREQAAASGIDPEVSKRRSAAACVRHLTRQLPGAPPGLIQLAAAAGVCEHLPLPPLDELKFAELMEGFVFTAEPSVASGAPSPPPPPPVPARRPPGGIEPLRDGPLRFVPQAFTATPGKVDWERELIFLANELGLLEQAQNLVQELTTAGGARAAFFVLHAVERAGVCASCALAHCEECDSPAGMTCHHPPADRARDSGHIRGLHAERLVFTAHPGYVLGTGRVAHDAASMASLVVGQLGVFADPATMALALAQLAFPDSAKAVGLAIASIASVVRHNLGALYPRVEGAVSYIVGELSRLLGQFTSWPLDFSNYKLLTKLLDVLLDGEDSQTAAHVPQWLSTSADLLGKLLGLSMGAAVTTMLIPEVVLDWAAATKITPGALIRRVTAAIGDLYERLQLAWAHRSLQPLFDITGPATKMIEAASELLNATVDNIPVGGTGDVKISASIVWVESRLANVTAMLKRVDFRVPGAALGNTKCNEAVAHAMRLKHRLRSSLSTGKMEPVTMLVWGNPGVGKTAFSQFFHQAVWRAAGIEGDASAIGVIPLQSEFPGDSMGSWVLGLTLDELGANNADRAPMKDPSLLLGIMGTVPCEAICSDVNMKGMRHFNPVSVALTSNYTDAGMRDYLKNIAAFMRRLTVVVELAVKPEFADGTTLDPDKYRLNPVVEGPWLFRVTRRVPTTDSDWYPETLLDGHLRGPDKRDNWSGDITEFARVVELRTKRALGRREAVETSIRDVMQNALGAIGGKPNLSGCRPAVSDRFGVENPLFEAVFTAHEERAAPPLVERVSSEPPTDAEIAVLAAAATGEAPPPPEFKPPPDRVIGPEPGGGIAGWWMMSGLFFLLGCFQAFGWAVPLWLASLACAFGATLATKATVPASWWAWLGGVFSGAWFLLPWGRYRLAAWAYHRCYWATARALQLSRTADAARLVAACAALGGAWAVWRIYRQRTEGPPKPRTFTAGEMSSTFKRTAELSSVDPVGWLATTRIVTENRSWPKAATEAAITRPVAPFVLSPVVAKDLDPEDLAKQELDYRTVRVVATGESGNRFSALGFAYAGDRVFGAWHTFNLPDGDGHFNISVTSIDPHMSSVEGGTVLARKGFTHSRAVDDSDLAVLQAPILYHRRRFAGVYPKLVSGLWAGQPAAYVHVDGDTVTLKRTRISSAGARRRYMPTHDGKAPFVWCLELADSSDVGCSGSGVITWGPLGLHWCGVMSLSTAQSAWALAVDKEIINDSLSRLTMGAAMPDASPDRGYTFTAGQGWCPPIDSLPPLSRSFLLASRAPRIGFYVGQIKRSEQKSLLCETPMWRDPEVRGVIQSHCGLDSMSSPFAQPLLRRGHNPVTGEMLDPAVSWVERLYEPDNLDFGLLMRAAKDVAEERVAWIQEIGAQHQPLTCVQAIFGDPALGVEPMRLDTSAGSWFAKLKSDFVRDGFLEPGLQMAVERIADELGDPEALFCEGAVAKLVGKLESLKPGKGARGIWPVSFPWVVVGKMLLYWLSRVNREAPLERGHNLFGINAADPKQWGAFADYLADDTIFRWDADAEWFDRNLNGALREADAYITYCEAKALGYSERWARAVANLARALSFALALTDGVAIATNGEEPSGAFATEYSNGNKNSAGVGYSVHRWRKEFGLAYRRFQDFVRHGTAGDDLGAGTRTLCRELVPNEPFGFTHHKRFARELGMGITPGSKEQRDTDNFTKDEHITFCKRYVYGATPGALVDRSLVKPLVLFDARIGCAHSERHQAAIDNVAAEAFLAGTTTFDAFRRCLEGKTYSCPDGSVFTVTYPKWEDLRGRYERGELRTWDSAAPDYGVRHGPEQPVGTGGFYFTARVTRAARAAEAAVLLALFAFAGALVGMTFGAVWTLGQAVVDAALPRIRRTVGIFFHRTRRFGDRLFLPAFLLLARFGLVEDPGVAFTARQETVGARMLNAAQWLNGIPPPHVLAESDEDDGIDQDPFGMVMGRGNIPRRDYDHFVQQAGRFFANPRVALELFSSLRPHEHFIWTASHLVVAPSGSVTPTAFDQPAPALSSKRKVVLLGVAAFVTAFSSVMATRPGDNINVVVEHFRAGNVTFTSGVELVPEVPTHGIDGETTAIARADGTGHEALGVGIPRELASGLEVLARPVQIGTASVTSATTGAFISINPLLAWANTSQVVRKLVNSRFISGSLTVHIQLACTQFHKGLFALCLIPGFSASYRSVPALTNAQYVQLAQKIVSFNDPSVTSVRVPINYLTSAVDMETTSGPAGINRNTPYLALVVLKPLAHATLSTPTVTVTVRACSEDAALAVPSGATAFTFTAQRGMAPELSPQGLISKPASLVARAAGMLKGLPIIGKYAQVAEVVAGAVSSVASFFGFAVPVGRLPAMPMVQHSMLDIGAATGVATVAPGDADPGAACTVGTGATGADSVDELDVSFLAGKWGLAAGSDLTTEWLSSRGVGYVLASIPVTPIFIDQGAGTAVVPSLTPAGVCAAGATYWRGVAEYRLIVTTATVENGRLILYHKSTGNADTNGGVPTTLRFSAILDVAEQQEFTFEVGWQQWQAVLPTPTNYAGIPSVTYGAECTPGPTANGSFNIAVDSPLVGNIALPAAGIMVLVRWKEFEVFRVSDRLCHNMVFTAQASHVVPSFGSREEAGSFTSSTFVSLRVPLVIPRPVASYSVAKDFASTANMFISWVLPGILPLSVTASWSTIPTNGTVGSQKVYRGHRDLIQACYTGLRGSGRWRMAMFGAPGETLTSVQAWVGQDDPAKVTVLSMLAGGTVQPYCPTAIALTSANLASATDFAGQGVFGAASAAYAGWGGNYGVAVPYNVAQPMVGTYDLSSPVSTTTGAKTAVFVMTVNSTNTSDITFRAEFTPYFNWGDDVRFFGFLCGPTIASGSL